MHLILERFLPPKWTKNDLQMGGKKLGKFHFGRHGRPRGAPRTPKATHWTPRTPKMEPKAPPDPPKPERCPELPKRCQSEPRAPRMGPKLPPRIQNGAQVSKLFKRSAHERTNTQTHKHTHTHTRTNTDRRRRLKTQRLTNPTNNPDSAARRNARSD